MSFVNEIEIDGKLISQKSTVYIIAEAGVNHGGDIQKAYDLIDIAVEAGADAVKFQAFRTEHLILDNVGKAEYQTQTTEASESQFDMLKKLELRFEQYKQVQAYCQNKGITFLITPFDEKSLEDLEEIGVQAYKIASTDTTNLPFLKKVALTGKPMILSTGMCDMEEVKKAVTFVGQYTNKLILLQCTANYPIKDEEANLNVIPVFKKEFSCLVGYSDHSVGIGAAPFAIPLGAVVLEKHFTISKDDDGPDHRASLDPRELKEFVKLVRRGEKFGGSNVKAPTDSEKGTKKSLQKCLVAAKNIDSGQVISESDLVAKRTGGKGISPLKFETIIGKKASRSYQANDIIEE
jgi:N-acetylneuraminate synthase